MYDKHVLYCRFVIYIISELWYWNKLHHKERLRCHECARYTLSNQHCKYNKLVRIKRQKWLIKPIACDCLAKKNKKRLQSDCPQSWLGILDVHFFIHLPLQSYCLLPKHILLQHTHNHLCQDSRLNKVKGDVWI